jgi:hypothetical protein
VLSESTYAEMLIIPLVEEETFCLVAIGGTHRHEEKEIT